MNLKVGQRLGDWSVVALMPVPKHVGFAEDSTGRHGVLKISKGGVYNDTRFHEEAAGMQGLVGQKGVLQLVDVEPSTCPRWMVTERAVLLTEHLGREPDLRSAVELFEQMANTLARLKSDKGIAHRDLKPPNMFVVDGRAVVGDFGIATWPGRAADLTEDGRGVGPMHFMAPETRSYNAKVDPFAADVYALAASLWAAAAGVPYPPAGVLMATREAASLYRAGGKPAHELARLLEVATADRPHNRPGMGELRDEMRHWLRRHPPGSTPRPKPKHFGQDFAELVHRSELAGGTVGISDACVRDLMNQLRPLGPAGSVNSEMDKSGELVGKYDPGSGDPDWQPDWTSPTRVLIWADHPWRIVAMAYGDGQDDLTYVVEWQHRNHGQWDLAWQGEQRARMRLPSDWAARDQLAERIQANDPRSADEPEPR